MKNLGHNEDQRIPKPNFPGFSRGNFAQELIMSPIISRETLNTVKTSSGLPVDCYYFIIAVTVVALNRNEDLKAILDDAFYGKPQQEQHRIMRRIREALIKSAAVIGLPKIIIALMTLKKSTPPALLDRPSENGMRTADFIRVPAKVVFERGQKFWETTYQHRHEKVMSALDNGTPDLGASARLIYSFFMSHEEVLSGKESLFVSMTGMIVTDVSSSHVLGMYGEYKLIDCA